MTTLSGDIGIVGIKADNSYLVVMTGEVALTDILDGLTITTGNANAGSTRGGGLYNSGNPTLTYLTFSSNSAPTFGGGIYNCGDPILTNVTIGGNNVLKIEINVKYSMEDGKEDQP